MFLKNKSARTYLMNTSVVCTELDEGAILLNLETKFYFNLNETGLRIWQLLEEHKDTFEVATKLTGEYAISIEKAKLSVMALVDELGKNKLIHQN